MHSRLLLGLKLHCTTSYDVVRQSNGRHRVSQSVDGSLCLLCTFVWRDVSLTETQLVTKLQALSHSSRVYCYSAPGAEYCDQSVSVSLSLCLCMCLSVCLSVRPRAYLWNRWADLNELFAQIPRGRGSVLFWRRCDTTSGFMDDVTFGRNWPYGASGVVIPGRSLMSTNALFSGVCIVLYVDAIIGTL